MNSEHPMTDRVVYRSLMADNLRWDALQLRDGDIIISAPSKSGLTWTQRLVSLLVFDGPDLPGPLSTVSPWLDQTIRPIEEVVATLDAQQHRRFIKTHTPLDGLVLDDSDSAHLVEMIRDAGDDVDLARIDVWDGYYCFAAELTSATLEVTFGGFGLHHDPNVALSRAITEAAQSRITAISGAREDLPSAIYHRFGRVHTYAKARKTSLRLNRARPTPWRVPDVDSLPELVASAATAVANRSGTEPLAVVCDFADACVPVVKVLAPGLVLSSASPMRTPLQEAE